MGSGPPDEGTPASSRAVAALAWVVPSEDAGARLDQWLAGRCETLTGGQAGRAVAEGRVRVGGEPAPKGGHRLRAGDEVTLIPAPPALPDESPRPEAIALPIIHEDAWLAVVDKPAGLVVHPAAGHPSGTMVNALLHHLDDLSGDGDDGRPGIVHRLDRDTSGLLVVAKQEAAHRGLAEQFKAHEVARRYLAVVLGPSLPDEGTIATRYGRHPRDRKRMTGRLPSGRRAVTHFSVIARGQGLALLVLRLETGRTHQIRVHLAEAGHPVVADPVYGRPAPGGGAGRLALELAAARRMPRQALHAATLGFVHPVTGELLSFAARPPEDLTTLVEQAFGEQALGEAMDAAGASNQ